MIYKQLLRYLIGGSFVFAVIIGLLYLFVDVLGMWYLWGTTFMFVISLGISFSVQKYWTFRDHSTDRLKGQMGIYTILQITNLAANDGLMYVAVDGFGLPHLLAQFFTAGIIAAWSFWAFRHLFKNRSLASVQFVESRSDTSL